MKILKYIGRQDGEVLSTHKCPSTQPHQQVALLLKMIGLEDGIFLILSCPLGFIVLKGSPFSMIQSICSDPIDNSHDKSMSVSLSKTRESFVSCAVTNCVQEKLGNRYLDASRLNLVSSEGRRNCLRSSPLMHLMKKQFSFCCLTCPEV